MFAARNFLKPSLAVAGSLAIAGTVTFLTSPKFSNSSNHQTHADYSAWKPSIIASPKESKSKTAAPAPTSKIAERTFIAVKPDGVQRALVGEIISRFEKRGYKLVAIKSLVPSKQLAEEHYGDLKSKPFYGGLVDYMTNGAAPVIAMVWEGQDVVKQGRAIIGATNPLDSAPGTIRGQFCISVGRNIIHGSDSVESASKEIGLWFGPQELIDWKSAMAEWIFAAN